MPKKTVKQRAAEQVGRQQKLRDTARETRTPSRDDIARIALWRFIHNTWHADPDPRKTLDVMRNSIVTDLEEQGFDVRQSELRWDELESKYRSSIKPFRIKRHLLRSGDDAPGGDGT